MTQPPKQFREFVRKYPRVAAAYEKLGTEVHAAGPLGDKTRALIKLSLSIGAQREGAVHSHVRKALAVGIKPAELRHAALLSLPTIGFPSMMAALSWIEDEIKASIRKRKSS